MDSDLRNLINKDLNVVVLGKSQNGKSTFLNAMVNYFMFSSLRDALSSGQLPYCIVPSRFNIEDQTVHIGNLDENEADVPVGDPATILPKEHHLKIRGHTINMIDTPGVGDARGTEQDRTNFCAILSKLAKFSELNAFLIIIKSDESLLDVVFEYCIKELLRHLHRSAARNIVFCFTHCQMGRIGNGLTLIRRILEGIEKETRIRIEFTNNTIYRFDNDPFRVLCAIKYGIDYSQEEKNIYNALWIQARNEMARLFQYLCQLAPHHSLETISMNTARQTVLKLAHGLTIVAQKLGEFEIILERKVKERYDINKDVEKLRKDLSVYVPMPKSAACSPRTVCIKHFTFSEGGVMIYRICHDNCQLKDILPEKHPIPGLRQCWAMTHRERNYGDTCFV